MYSNGIYKFEYLFCLNSFTPYCLGFKLGDLDKTPNLKPKQYRYMYIQIQMFVFLNVSMTILAGLLWLFISDTTFSYNSAESTISNWIARLWRSSQGLQRIRYDTILILSVDWWSDENGTGSPERATVAWRTRVAADVADTSHSHALHGARRLPARRLLALHPQRRRPRARLLPVARVC